MTRGVCLYLVGSFVLLSLVGCGRGAFQTAEREPWRAEAERACLKSGAIKETAELVRVEPISGPGVCGAEYPLKVAALGESFSSLGFANDLRPPAAIGGAGQPRWPVNPPPMAAPRSYPVAAPQPQYQQQPQYQPQAGYGGASNAGPVSLNPPGVEPEEDDIALPAEGEANYPSSNGAGYRPPSRGAAPYDDRYQRQSVPQEQPLPRLGPGPGLVTGSVGPVAMKPTATLACPIVTALDRWLAEAVQPAAMRWFGVRVVEIKQISAYSCRGMNGNSRARISEHAFGNALDIASFMLADGRRITVKGGWKGMPEEQGFLREIQGAACEQFNTVLAPGSNIYHYDHIHVDLMRRTSRRSICKPAAMSGEEIAALTGRGNAYAGRAPGITGSLGARRASVNRSQRSSFAADDEDIDAH